MESDDTLFNGETLNHVFVLLFQLALIAGTILLAAENIPGEYAVGLWFFVSLTYFVVAIYYSHLPLSFIGLPWVSASRIQMNLKGRTAITFSSVFIVAVTAIFLAVSIYYRLRWQLMLVALPFGVVYAFMLYFLTKRALRSSQTSTFRWW